MNVIIRPCGGDFCYSDVEYETMKLDIELCKQVGADGVVIGLLHPDGTVDAVRTRTLIALARPLSVTFHRAFDVSRDPFAALEMLIELGVDRILTTGQDASPLEGLELIAELVRRAGDRITIMPGGVSERTVGRIVAGCGAREVHGYLPVTVEGRMIHRNTRVFIGGELRPPEYALTSVDAGRVAALTRVLRQRPVGRAEVIAG